MAERLGRVAQEGGGYEVQSIIKLTLIPYQSDYCNDENHLRLVVCLR